MNEQAVIDQEAIVLPWEVDKTADKWLWPVNYIATRSFYDRKIWKEPKDKRLDNQVLRLMEWLQGPRNFIMCFCSSPRYMRDLYQYLLASWALTTSTRSEIADIQTLMSAVFEPNSPKWEAIEEADLLIIPYADKSHVGLKKIRGHLSNMLLRRRSLNKPTITDIWVSENPPFKNGEIHRSWYGSHAIVIKDILGELASDLFEGDNSKYVYVSSKNE
jgi:hypothetical protein